MNKTTETMMQLISSEVCENTLSLSTPQAYSDGFLVEMYNISKAHDVVHLVGSALINNNLLEGCSIESQYRNQVYTSVFRHEKFNYIYEQVSAVLEESHIPYIPLKGMVIRELYPQPWMRTSCDIDILIHEENIALALERISKALGYTEFVRGKHDVSIVTIEQIHVELHFSLLEESHSLVLAKVLDDVWDYAKPCEPNGFRYELDDSMFYFYHIAHMAKHFMNGGCGIRPFLDLWLLNHSKDYLTDETKALLAEGKLTDFCKYACLLSEVWFSEQPHDEITQVMQEYVISGGCFGSVETKMMSAHQRAGGKFKYIISRIFVPYDDLKGRYPILKKYRFMTPICEICRWASLLVGKKRNFRKAYMERIQNVPDEHVNDINLLFESVGL